MSQYYDVVVVGGGVIGCSVAYHLAKRDFKVMVVESGAIGGQASSVAPGMLAAQEEPPAPDAFFEACQASIALYKTLVPEVREVSGIDPHYEISGVWRVAQDEAEAEPLLEKKRWQEARGLPVEWHDGETLLREHPGLVRSYGALYCPTDGQVHSALWVRALAEAARRHGVRFLDWAEPVEVLREGTRIAGVRTPEGDVISDHMVLAAGAWTVKILETLNISLPLEPVKGELMILSAAPRAFSGPIFAGGGYIVPKPDHVVVGSTMDRVGFDTRPSLAAQRKFADWMSLWCPTQTALRVVEFRANLRPGTADNWPVLGRLWDYDNLFIAAGHFRNGILLSPWTGRYMAEGIATGRWDPLGEAFSPRRFQTAGARA